MIKSEDSNWDIIIKPGASLFDLRIKEIIKSRDLLFMFIIRDFKQFYKQTALGPLWFVVQPFLTMLIYVLIFGNIAKLPSDGLPRPIFYLSGITAWGYFALCLTRTSTVLKDNKNIFSKVYFPRIVLPLSIVISNLLRFGVQFVLLILAIAYFAIFDDFAWTPSIEIFLIPFLVIIMAVLGFSLGLIVASMTTIYRDLALLIAFSTQLLMWLTTVVYPLSYVPDQFRSIIQINPMTHVVEGFRKGLLGQGTFELSSLIYLLIVTSVLFLISIASFNKVEKTFVDTI